MPGLTLHFPQLKIGIYEPQTLKIKFEWISFKTYYAFLKLDFKVLKSEKNGDIRTSLLILLTGGLYGIYIFFFQIGKITLRVTTIPRFYCGIIESDFPRNYLLCV